MLRSNIFNIIQPMTQCCLLVCGLTEGLGSAGVDGHLILFSMEDGTFWSICCYKSVPLLYFPALGIVQLRIPIHCSCKQTQMILGWRLTLFLFVSKECWNIRNNGSRPLECWCAITSTSFKKIQFKKLKPSNGAAEKKSGERIAYCVDSAINSEIVMNHTNQS